MGERRAGDVRAGGAYVEIGADRSRLESGLLMARKRLSQFVTRIGDLGRRMIILGAAMAAPLIIAVKHASDFIEQLSKFRVVFGTRQEIAVTRWSEAMAKAVGRSTSAIMKFMAAMQDTFVPLGFARDKAAELSASVVKLAIDIGSFNNAADDEVLLRLQSALVGNHETVRRFGIIITQVSLNQELLNMGIKGGVKAATEQQKVLARLNIIIAGSSDALDDAVETAHTFANSLKRLQGMLKTLSETIGSKILPILAPYLKSISNIVEKTTKWVESNATAVRIYARLSALLLGVGSALFVVSRGLTYVWKSVKTAAILLPIVLLADALGLIPKRVKEMILSFKIAGRALREWIKPLQEGFAQIWTMLKATGFGVIDFFSMIGHTIIAMTVRVVKTIATLVTEIMAKIAGTIPVIGEAVAKSIRSVQKEIGTEAGMFGMFEKEAWDRAGKSAKTWFGDRRKEFAILGNAIKEIFGIEEVLSKGKKKLAEYPILKTAPESNRDLIRGIAAAATIRGTMMPWRIMGGAGAGNRVLEQLKKVVENTDQTAKNTAKAGTAKYGE